eukprot:scaffold4302_cov183-Ochromonas_danica.AAC.8
MGEGGVGRCGSVWVGVGRCGSVWSGVARGDWWPGVENKSSEDCQHWDKLSHKKGLNSDCIT